MRKKLKIAALISGSGTNLQAVIDSCLKKIINAEIVCVGSDRPDALGLKRAEKHNIPTFITDYKEIIRDKDIERRLPEDFDCEKILSLQRLFHKGEIEKKEFFLKTRAAAEADMLDKLSNFRFDLIILAGFMRKLTPYFIDKINTDSICPRIMNIHPSLLPAFAGTDGYKDTFEYGAKLGGCTVHFVDYGEDTGAVIGQRCFPIFPEDTLETVRTKGLSAEWELYTEAIKLFEERRLRLVKRSLTTSKGVNIEREIVEILERTV